MMDAQCSQNKNLVQLGGGKLKDTRMECNSGSVGHLDTWQPDPQSEWKWSVRPSLLQLCSYDARNA